MSKPLPIKTISAFHQYNGLPKPEHPLVSIVDYDKLNRAGKEGPTALLFGYYTISLKRGVSKMQYGQQQYDFDEGVLYFMAPNQILKVNSSLGEATVRSGWLLLIHPDFLWNTALAARIRQFEFFDYSVNEALFLSDKEEEILNGIIQNIRREYHSNIDKFSQSIIISQIETLLNYSERFYQRQFLTRKISNHQILARLEQVLDTYFASEDLLENGLPSVQYVANALHVSPGYLGSLLKVSTGQSTQQHIHDKLIDKAKERLSTTDMTVTEIAYSLGFEHSQSFSKLFKSKTRLSPLQFRHSFN